MNATTASNSWKGRAALGIIGQGFVLSSAFMNGRFDAGVAGFSACNLAANAIAMKYGASHKKDTIELEQFTQHVGDIISEKGGDRQAVITAKSQPSDPSVDGFLREHASKLSIGLRYIGAANMMASGMATDNAAKMQGAALALTGKTMALSQYTRSPFDETELSSTESLRSHGFKAGALTEALAYSRMAYDGFSKYGADSGGMDNLMFGIGQSCFVAAYMSRLGAKFETLELDYETLGERVAQGLLTVPPEQQHAALYEVKNTLEEISHSKGQAFDAQTFMSEVASHISVPPSPTVMQPCYDTTVGSPHAAMSMS